MNVHLKSGAGISKNMQDLVMVKMAEQTLILSLITHNPSLNHFVYYIDKMRNIFILEIETRGPRVLYKGPVNDHLISGPSLSTIHTKSG